jgi:hypothetical protein
VTAIRIVIDNKVEFDDDLDEWVSQPPDFAKDMIKPNGVRPEAHLLGIMMAMSNAVVLNEATSITVKTYVDGWTMTVERLG